MSRVRHRLSRIEIENGRLSGEAKPVAVQGHGKGPAQFGRNPRLFRLERLSLKATPKNVAEIAVDNRRLGAQWQQRGREAGENHSE